MRARYLIDDHDQSAPGMQPWVDMPEAEPRTRARLKTAGAEAQLLTVEDDGTISGPLDFVDLDTTYEEPPSIVDEPDSDQGK